MAKKNVVEEEILETAEETVNDIIEGVAEMDLDVSDFIGDPKSFKSVLKAGGVAASVVGSAAGGYLAAKKDIFGQMKASREEKKYAKALEFVDRHDHPEKYAVEDDSEEVEKPDKKFKKNKK